MSGAPEEPPDDLERRRAERRGPADRVLAPMLSDSTLWPILIVMLVVLATFFGSVLLMAARQRSLAATAALLGLAWLTTAAVRADLGREGRRRLGPTSGLLFLLWALSIAVAVVGGTTGLL